QINGVQRRNVDAELHRRRAEEYRKKPRRLVQLGDVRDVVRKVLLLLLAVAEALFADFPLLALDLRRMLARLESEQRMLWRLPHQREAGIEVFEERVVAGAFWRAGSGEETNAAVVEPPAHCPVKGSGLFGHEAVF